MSRARLVAIVLVTIWVMLFARTAYAQSAPDRLDLVTFDFTPGLLNASAVPVFRMSEQVPLAPVVPVRPTFGGKSLMTSLYATTALMQALDVHSTLSAIKAGAVEANPIMGRLSGNPGALVASKAAVAAVSIWAAHKISKKNKVAAVVTLVAVNSAYAMIVSHNYRLARR
jgi:hypothetical protein